jgi:hypothetical protein
MCVLIERGPFIVERKVALFVLRNYLLLLPSFLPISLLLTHVRQELGLRLRTQYFRKNTHIWVDTYVYMHVSILSTLVFFFFACESCIIHVSRWQILCFSFTFLLDVSAWWKTSVQYVLIYSLWHQHLVYCEIWGSHGDQYDSWSERGTSWRPTFLAKWPLPRRNMLLLL